MAGDVTTSLRIEDSLNGADSRTSDNPNPDDDERMNFPVTDDSRRSLYKDGPSIPPPRRADRLPGELEDPYDDSVFDRYDRGELEGVEIDAGMYVELPNRAESPGMFTPR